MRWRLHQAAEPRQELRPEAVHGQDSLHDHVRAGQVRLRLEAPLHLPPRPPQERIRRGETREEVGREREVGHCKANLKKI